MTQYTERDPTTRHKVLLWVQVIVWIFLLGLLAVLAASLFKAQVPIIKVGQAVPDFTVPLYEGYEYNGVNEIHFSELYGKVVLINFWASWCVPCEDEASLMEEAWRYYRPDGEVIFLGIDFVDTPGNGMKYLEKFAISYPTGPDFQGSISPYFNRKMGVPETYIVDRRGILRAIKIGPFTSIEQIQAILEPLIAEK